MSKPIHVMTDPEKMIWAAVYAREFNLRNPPSHCLSGEGSDERWAEWEANKCHQAAEVASAAVEHLREQRESIQEGHKGFATATFVNQMVVWK